MPPIDALTAFVVAAFAIVVVPGPSVMFVVSRAVALGRRAAVAGNAAGVYVQVILVAAGLGVAAGRSLRTLRTEGFVVGVASPKTIVVFAAILPQFVRDGAAPIPAQMAVLGVIFVIVALLSDTVWAVAAGTARNRFADSPHRLERLGAIAAP
jgi:threonine/homoserine/homoserine lactone efflux protein